MALLAKGEYPMIKVCICPACRAQVTAIKAPAAIVTASRPIGYVRAAA